MIFGNSPGITYRCEGVAADEKILAFKTMMAGQNNDHWRGGKKDAANRSTGEGFLKPYFESIHDISMADVLFETPILTMFWRSVYASTNGFAYETFVDELAHAGGSDPLDFRRQHLKEERLQILIDKVEELTGWKKRGKNQGFGVAITACFGSTVAQVVSVSRATAGVKIDRVWAVIACGWYVKPDTIRAQVEGAIVMGIDAVTMREITFKDGV